MNVSDLVLAGHGQPIKLGTTTFRKGKGTQTLLTKGPR